MHTIRLAILCALVSVALSPASRAQDSSRDLSQIIESGVLRAGIAAFPPWAIPTEEGYRGFEVDVVNQLANDMGIRAEFVNTTFETALADLNSNAFDLIPGFIHPERALVADFTNEYASAGISIVANVTATGGIETLEDANDPNVIIAVVTDTLAADIAERAFPGATIRRHTTSEAAMADVLDGTAQFLVDASPVPEHAAARNPEVLFLPLSEPLIETAEAFSVRRDSPHLKAFLNSWIVFRTRDRWLEETRGYWFDSVDWEEAPLDGSER